MSSKRLVVAALVLLGVAVVVLEETLVHTDDGCAVETHCSACLLQLGTRGVVTETYSLPRVAEAVERVAPVLPASFEDAPPRGVPSRAPPAA